MARKMTGLHGLVNPAHDPSLPLNGGLSYYLNDLQGNVTALTNQKGSVVEEYRYDAFGGLFTGITAPYNTVGMTGHQFDPAAGLVNMKARWYQPAVGRFMTPDTYMGEPQTPWTQNRYAYVGNNPINRWDPTGNFPCSLGVSSCVQEIPGDPWETNFYYLWEHTSSSSTDWLGQETSLSGITDYYRHTPNDVWLYSLKGVQLAGRKSRSSGAIIADPAQA